MNERSFLDTNVLLYTDDASANSKRQTAVQLIEKLRLSADGVVSTQVLQEYFSAATRKLGVPPEVARSKVEIFGRFQLVQTDLPLILEAIDLHRLHQISIWDALIVRAAGGAGCTVLYTEDLQHERRFGKLQIVNPFAD